MSRSRPVRTDIRGTLQEAVAHLAALRAMVVVAAAALRAQSGDLDADVAQVLQRGVAQGITEQIERLRRL